MNLGPTELLIILAIVLLIFGSTKLPKLARAMGEASHEFRKGVAGGARGDAEHDAKVEGSTSPDTRSSAAPESGTGSAS